MKASISFVRDSNPKEFRSLIFPDLIQQYTYQDVQVICEKGIGSGYGVPDQAFEAEGAIVLPSEEVWGRASLIAKYKPATAADVARMPKGCSYASYLHLEDNQDLASALCKHHIRAFAFEFIEEPKGQFPVTRGHSEIAGKMAVIYGSYHLQSHLGGNGIFLPSVPDATPGNVLVIGYGNSGAAAAITAAALGANVTVLGRSPSKLRAFAALMPRNVDCLVNGPGVLESLLPDVDLVIGAILISTRDTPALISEKMVRSMKKGSMIVDVTCGYGAGYLESFDRESTLDEPVYQKFGVLHCKIDKLPGGVPVTSAQSLSKLSLPYLSRLAKIHLLNDICDAALARAEVTYKGKISNKYVATTLANGQRPKG